MNRGGDYCNLGLRNSYRPGSTGQALQLTTHIELNHRFKHPIMAPKTGTKKKAQVMWHIARAHCISDDEARKGCET